MNGIGRESSNRLMKLTSHIAPPPDSDIPKSGSCKRSAFRRHSGRDSPLTYDGAAILSEKIAPVWISPGDSLANVITPNSDWECGPYESSIHPEFPPIGSDWEDPLESSISDLDIDETIFQLVDELMHHLKGADSEADDDENTHKQSLVSSSVDPDDKFVRSCCRFLPPDTSSPTSNNNQRSSSKASNNGSAGGQTATNIQRVPYHGSECSLSAAFEVQRSRLKVTMKKSSGTQKSLHKWDRKQGLPASHARTMLKTSRSRKLVQQQIVLHSPSTNNC